MDKAKNIWYSSPLKFYWDKLYGTQKKLTPSWSDEQIFFILRSNIISAPLAISENQENRELLLNGLQLWKEDLNKEFLHIFFEEKYLRDFLETTSLSDLDGVRKYLYENGQNKDVVYVKTKTQIKCVVYNFGLHIPFETDGYAFSLSLFENNSVELYFSHGQQNGMLSDKFYADLNKRDDHKSVALSKMFRLAFNTIAYMKCFPECVTEGVPKISLNRAETRTDKNIIFRLSEKVTESKKSPLSKIPHFRKGFFKVLRSDYYTHKQGQLIFITQTMVKGKAKTVSTSPRIEEFESEKV